MIQTSTRLRADLKKRLDAYLGRGGIAQGALNEGLEMWLDLKEGKSKPTQSNEQADPVSPYRQANIEWHDILEIVLNNPVKAPVMKSILELAEKDEKPKGLLHPRKQRPGA